jgi:hypothetical protein
MLRECGEVLGDDPMDALLAALEAETTVENTADFLRTLSQV